MTERLTVIDPRMPAPTDTATLATRATDLSDRRILLLDNGKLGHDYGPYRAVFDALEAALAEQHRGVTTARMTDDLLVGGVDRLEGLAATLADDAELGGVVIALCDWGVSQPSTILAAELERRGVPVCLVTMQVGFLMALSTAVLLAPGLPIVKLSSLRDASYDDMLAEATRIAPDVLRGLTAGPDELQRDFDAHGPKLPPVAEPDGTITLDAADAPGTFTALLAESGLGDGLPLVPPTPDRVEAMLDAMGVDGTEEVWPMIPPRRVPVVAREVATLAVMAGVPRGSAPVVLAAYRAMAEPEFRLFQAAITTHPGGTLVLVSGPRSDELGIAHGRGCLGPGFPGNATVGRAVALSYSFLLGALPGGSDLTAQGSPAEFTYCCAENLEESPWPGFHVDSGHGDATTVTVFKTEGPHNMLDQMSSVPERLLETFADTIATLGANSAYVPGCQTVLFLNPEHATLLAAAGWSRSDVQNYLFDVARNPRSELAGRGLTPIWPAWFDVATDIPVVLRPEDLIVAVVGGAGPASQVAIPWGYSRAVTKVVGG
jgi:hypothetical protein